MRSAGEIRGILRPVPRDGGNETLIRSQVVPVFLGWLEGTGGDAAALARRWRLPADVTTLREIVVPLRTVHELTDEVARQVRDPNLGLHIGMRLPRGSYGLIEFIGRSAPTVIDACRRFVRYASLLNETHVFAIEESGSVTALIQRSPGQPLVGGRHPNEMFVALIVRTVRELTDASGAIRTVMFAHPAPADFSEHGAFFRCPVEFGRGENRIEFEPSLLNHAVKGGDEALLSVLDEQAERILRERPTRSDGLARIREQVRIAVKDGQPSLERLADALHASPRTLQRRLAEEGTSFNRVVDQVREELARLYIADPRLTLGEVAYLLGFSEISAFSRAFKRWTGLAPAVFRARHSG
jgi:AraC-like DNA-binding protein